MQNLAADRMLQNQQIGVERLPAKGGKSRLGRGSKLVCLGLEAGPIDIIAEQWMADMGKMHPDLVGAASLEL